VDIPVLKEKPELRVIQVLKEQQANQKTATYIDQLKTKSRIEVYI
jgi:hypothetical protein